MTMLSETSFAPFYHVPNHKLVSIEHPYLVNDIERGIASLGGTENLKKLVVDDPRTQASLHYRPGNRMTKSISSANVETNDILLRLTVPKRTGRRRRRGASVPFHGASEDFEESSNAFTTVSEPQKIDTQIQNTQYLLECLRSTSGRHTVAVMGTIGHTHRFRKMPDFVLSSANAPFMNKMRETILPFKYHRLKEFTLDNSKGIVPHTEIIPPPVWSTYDMPFNYSYHQNPAVKQFVNEEGKRSMINLQAPVKVLTQPVPFNAVSVPQAPHPDVLPLETQEPIIQQTVAAARQAMEDCPIFTRKKLMNLLPYECRATMELRPRQVFQYVGYLFTSGPWRDAIVKLGIDPRKDPKYRVHQTMMFMLESEPQDNRKTKSGPRKAPTTRAEHEKSRYTHVYDGTSLNTDGKVYHVCDITDPVMRSILDTDDLRPQCHDESDGWYWNGTWAAAKVLIRAQMADILKGLPPNNALYEKTAADMPTIIRKTDFLTRLDHQLPGESRLRQVIRATAIGFNSKTERVSDTLPERQDDESFKTLADEQDDSIIKETNGEARDIDDTMDF